jgi:uncharacterized protein YggE
MRTVRAVSSIVVTGVLLLSASSRLLRAQDGGSAPSIKAPQLNASATGEIELRPDRATLMLSVESRGSTAAKAAGETAKRQKQVLDTLRALGIAAEQIQTASLQINPEFVSAAPGGRTRVSGYVATSTIRVDILKVEQVGAVVDAGLSGEATGIQGLQFGSSKEGEARKQALALAVSKAKGEAEAMAVAAGGALGGLIELNAQQDMPRMYASAPMSFAKAARSESMPVVEGTIRVSATVSGRWGFIPR